MKWLLSGTVCVTLFVLSILFAHYVGSLYDDSVTRSLVTMAVSFMCGLANCTVTCAVWFHLDDNEGG
jgi:uncharacterized membrane protein YoaK (UPF0700 family)